MKYRFLNSLVFLSILLSLTLGAVGVTPAYAASSITFDYTGAEQQYVVPAGVYLIKVDASGAQGQSGNAGSSGGLGARAQATIAVTPGETLYIYVGGLNGYNGGGTGYSTYGNGGGASDVRQSGNGTGNRVVVAGGGGGGGGGSLAIGGTITSGYKGGNGQVILTPLMDFTVTFNGNGNTGGTMSNQSASVPTALTLNTFTKTGYTFAGWNTALGGNGTAYADGAIYNFSADVTLYAQWNIAPKVTTDSIETLSNRQVNATLSDLGSPASVTAYGVVYSTTSNPDTGDSMVDIGSTTTTGPFTVGLDAMSLTPGTQYYVRAFATNATGTSYGNELVVYGTPGAFTTIAPADGATDLSTSPTLSWNASTGATDYQYCVQANIADCVADMFGANWHSTGGATSANLSGLSSGTNYSWAVRAVVGTPASYKWATDAPFTFTTAAIPSHTVTFNGNGSNGGSMKNQSANSATALTANAFTRSGYTFSGWNTAANGSGTAYADGAIYNFSADITLYAQWTVANSAILPSPWLGSVSVSADKNVVTVGRPHIGAEIASYDGFSSGALSSYVPMLFKDAFGGSYDAALYVQNISASSANVTIQFYDSTGTLSCTKNDTVSPLASKGYWLPSESCLPAGWVGSALVTSDQPIVAIGRPHIGSEVMTYNGFSAGSTSASIPMLFKDAFGGSYDSAFYIQNIHPSNTANITINFYDSTGALSCTKNDTVSPLASKGYWVPSESCLPTGWVGGVIVSSDQPIVSVGRPHIGSQITTYNGFSAGSSSSFIPMLFKDAFGGSYDAAFYLQNTHSSNTANITIQFYDSAGSLSCTKNDTLAPFASKGYWVPSEACLPTGWVGGVIVSSDQPIVGVGRPHIGPQITTYNGFSSGSSSSFLSMLFKDAFGGSYDSAFYIQNTEATQATVTTKFYDSAGTLSCSRTDLIPPKATLGIWVPSATCTP